MLEVSRKDFAELSSTCEHQEDVDMGKRCGKTTFACRDCICPYVMSSFSMEELRKKFLAKGK
jgi:hypothetical protein